MDRRDFLTFSSAAAAAGFILDPREAFASFQPPAASAPSQPAPASTLAWAAPFDSPPCVQNATPTSVSITVAVNAITTAWVEWGLNDKLDQRADGALHGMMPLNGRVHTFRLTGLKPGTRYSYRVAARPIDFKGAYKITAGPESRSPVYSFTTPDGGAESKARFSLINDTHEKPDTLAAMTGLLAKTPADLHFWNGDIFDDVRHDNQLVDQILRPVNAPYSTTTPMQFVAGNHDVRGIHARNLDRFAPPPEGLRYYQLRQGPVAFIVLDTGEDKPDDHKVYAGLNGFAAYRQTQAQWLAEAIKSPQWRTAPFRVCVLHIPLWGNGASLDSRAKWHALLEEGKTDLTISGHIHKYSYTPADTTHRYHQLVAGGPALETATFVHATADNRSLDVNVLDHTGKEIGSHTLKPA